MEQHGSGWNQQARRSRKECGAQRRHPDQLRQTRGRDQAVASFAAQTLSARRTEREGAQTGDVQTPLPWNKYNDLDLHMICPSGEEIYVGNKKSRCGRELDVDMNVTLTSNEPVENVFWPSGRAAKGRYKVFVHHD